jgi:hypothetical protein
MWPKGLVESVMFKLGPMLKFKKCSDLSDTFRLWLPLMAMGGGILRGDCCDLMEFKSRWRLLDFLVWLSLITRVSQQFSFYYVELKTPWPNCNRFVFLICLVLEVLDWLVVGAFLWFYKKSLLFATKVCAKTIERKKEVKASKEREFFFFFGYYSPFGLNWESDVLEFWVWVVFSPCYFLVLITFW